MSRNIFVAVPCLASSARAFADDLSSLQLSRLDCKVESPTYVNYPVGSTLTYDAKSDQIFSQGFR